MRGVAGERLSSWLVITNRDNPSAWLLQIATDKGFERPILVSLIPFLVNVIENR